jgi:hypothetical protein
MLLSVSFIVLQQNAVSYCLDDACGLLSSNTLHAVCLQAL